MKAKKVSSSLTEDRIGENGLHDDVNEQDVAVKGCPPQNGHATPLARSHEAGGFHLLVGDSGPEDQIREGTPSKYDSGTSHD